ncbi:MAG: HAD hydrolase family protein, partial [Propioniciclava sp.]
IRSSAEWVDIINPRVNKGSAIRALQQSLGVDPEQTIVFGDYLNDLEMLRVTPYSFAVANAHPEVIAAASGVVPANADHGVIRTLQVVLAALA